MKLLKYILPYSLILMGATLSVMGQCKDESYFENAWISCETSPSPNAIRGVGHWIQYDLGYAYQLSSLQIWNNNYPGSLDMGVRELIMDVSDDGRNWIPVDSFAVNKGIGETYYSGEFVGQLNDIQARYVLFTIKENWGHPTCASIDEISFKLKQAPLPKEESLWLYPNPAKDKATLSFEMEMGESVLVKVSDLMGKEVLLHHHEAISGRQEVKLNTTNLRPGIYVVQVLAGDDEVLGSKKLIIGR